VIGIDPLGVAGPTQRLQAANVGANEALRIAADTIDGCSRPLKMLGRAIDASFPGDIHDVAVRGARTGRGGASHDDHASVNFLGAGGIHLDVMHAPVHPIDQQPDPFAHLVAAKPFVAADDALGRVLSMQDVARGMAVVRLMSPRSPSSPASARPLAIQSICRSQSQSPAPYAPACARARSGGLDSDGTCRACRGRGAGR
jgi:hypothetical protein